MATNEGSPELSPRGAFAHPYLQFPDKVAERRAPGVVETDFEAVEEGPDAVLPPRSDKSTPEGSVAERWRARLEAED